MVITLHRCSYDNSTIISVNKLKQYDASLLSSLLSLFFLSLFFLICFSSLCQRVVLLNLLDIKVNPNCLLFHRERERENRRSPVVRGWSGGAMVLGKYPEPKRPTNLDNSRARVCCTCSRCGRGLFGHFFLSSIFYLFFLTLWETA